MHGRPRCSSKRCIRQLTGYFLRAHHIRLSASYQKGLKFGYKLISTKVRVPISFQPHINQGCNLVRISTSYQPRLKFCWNPDVVSTSEYRPHINQGWNLVNFFNLILNIVRVSRSFQHQDFNLTSTNVRVSTSCQPHINQGWHLVDLLPLIQHWNDVDNLSTRFQPDINLISTNIARWAISKRYIYISHESIVGQDPLNKSLTWWFIMNWTYLRLKSTQPLGCH